MKESDPRERKENVTNTDEQDVAVNQSTTEHGYDAPVSEQDSEVEKRGAEDPERRDSLPERGRSGRPVKNDDPL